MKKIITALSIGIILLASCATGKTSAGGTAPLDDAIRALAEHIENTLEKGARVALLNFSSPSEDFSAYVLDELSDRLVNGGKVVVVERAELDLIRQEEHFQYSGEVSDATAVSIGQKVGAKVIVSGSLTGIGRTYRMRIRVLDVETAVIAASRSGDIDSREERVKTLLAGKKPVAEKTSQAPQQPAAAPAQTAPLDISFVRVEGGTFQMGSNSGGKDERPIHTVTITGFYMGKYEVTQKEWTAVMGSNPSYFKGDNLPVEQVSWYDAVEFCNRLSQREGLPPAYTISGSGNSRTVTWNRSANGYRLPTEAEWEYAARGGNGSPGNHTYSGSNTVDEVAWYDKNSGGSTQNVGTKKPNGLGLYDMSGNVREWCWDWKGTYSSSTQIDPAGASSGSSRVVRGGYWHNSAGDVRSAYRNNYSPSTRYNEIGFRLVRP